MPYSSRLVDRASDYGRTESISIVSVLDSTASTDPVVITAGLPWHGSLSIPLSVPKDVSPCRYPY